jgi:hypothetical protein
VAVLEITRYPEELVGRVVLMSGSGIYPHMDSIMDWIESWCRERGCRKITELGRPGWARAAKRRGYSQQPCLLVWKEL